MTPFIVSVISESSYWCYSLFIQVDIYWAPTMFQAQFQIWRTEVNKQGKAPPQEAYILEGREFTNKYT